MSSGEGLRQIDIYEAKVFPSGIVSPRLHARGLAGATEDFIGRERVNQYLERYAGAHNQLLRTYSVDSRVSMPVQTVEAMLEAAHNQRGLREVLTAKELTAVTATDPNAQPGFATRYAQDIQDPTYAYDPSVDDIDGTPLAELMLTEVGKPTRLLKEVIQTRIELDLNTAVTAVALGMTGASLACDYIDRPDVRKHFPASTLSRIGAVSNNLAVMDVTATVGSHLHPKSIGAVDQTLATMAKNGLRIPRASLPPDIAQLLENIDDVLLHALTIRNKPEVHTLYTTKPTAYHYHPSNIDFAAAREAIHITKPLSA